MRKDLYEHLEKQQKLQQFIRENPNWYRKITRNPTNIYELELASKTYFKQTIPHKVQKFSQSVEFATMMIQMYKAMQQGD